jgi:hypothetical protein
MPDRLLHNGNAGELLRLVRYSFSANEVLVLVLRGLWLLDVLLSYYVAASDFLDVLFPVVLPASVVYYLHK